MKFLPCISSSLLAIILGLYSATVANARDQLEQDWREFRKEFPFHIQTIAVSEPSQSETQTVIISEPPPSATLQGMRLVAPTIMAEAVVKQHPVGIDGWVKDVVTSCPRNQ